ncbi:MAG: D-alanyl-D-alanine endopeptidase (penicillin-binding protein 7) [Parcubacteria group bacterium LiPW_15]|nr:MAG: D-alanyl-D-alanine endopeptidase (penicillin-binding protein 7) [Parcubacteria group bacterium LiPW_15]
MMKYRLQIVTFFAVVIVVLLGSRGFAEKIDVVSVANIGEATGILRAEESGAPVPPADNSVSTASAMLGETAQLSPKPPFYRVTNDPLPEIGSESAIIFDVQSGEKYLDIASAKRWPIASLSKLMTAVVVYERLDLDSKIVLAKEDFADGDNPIFTAGETYKTRDLLKVMLVASRNTAANALARSYGYETFLREMNDKAKGWGMDNTNFDDPSGLSVSNQSSADDLLKLVRGVTSERPEIWKTTENAKVSIKDAETGKVRNFTSTNQFVSRRDFYGGKTGYTLEANGNLISVFLYGKRTIGIIVLGSADRFGDTEKLFTWFTNDFRTSN